MDSKPDFERIENVVNQIYQFFLVGFASITAVQNVENRRTKIIVDLAIRVVLD